MKLKRKKKKNGSKRKIRHIERMTKMRCKGEGGLRKNYEEILNMQKIFKKNQTQPLYFSSIAKITKVLLKLFSLNLVNFHENCFE